MLSFLLGVVYALVGLVLIATAVARHQKQEGLGGYVAAAGVTIALWPVVVPLFLTRASRKRGGDA